MKVLCLDLEGVLIPEIWQAVADHTGIEELQKTTRDIPVYTDLMDLRLKVLNSYGINIATIQNVIQQLEPLPGANKFLDWARLNYQVAIISDTFYEFADPLMQKLNRPLLLCHKLVIQNEAIIGYKIRQPDPKRMAVKAFKSLEYEVFAAGDSYNDVSMLDEADHGFFFQAPEKVLVDYPQYPLVSSYEDLQAILS
ncbi:MAG: bifunctional phosphoserine phosphatase/homoserine phosphotransferase ThrH [Gammaproteobacteria bacterium]|nr:bifunctional phosphoserine phosphatase/homoserine phosphotransferase ThrH [Gammaproteobacteria bacterium]|tara:strand:+ start:141 stop:728 length:588 start_codon:yes stop_codon:yes gene_type:complete